MSSMSQDLTLYHLAAELGGFLCERGWRVTAAESCTGGGVARAITEVAGSSEWFEAGFVTYANWAKRDFLGVSAESLQSEGAVSQAVVEQMAQGARARAGADLAVATSGVAGPGGGSADKPVGTVWFAWAGPGDDVISECYVYEGDRAAVRRQSCVTALRELLNLAKRGS